MGSPMTFCADRRGSPGGMGASPSTRGDGVPTQARSGRESVRDCGSWGWASPRGKEREPGPGPSAAPAFGARPCLPERARTPDNLCSFCRIVDHLSFATRHSLPNFPIANSLVSHTLWLSRPGQKNTRGRPPLRSLALFLFLPPRSGGAFYLGVRILPFFSSAAA